MTGENNSNLRPALILGSLTALGAFGIDTYLPAFPAIAKSLGVDEGRVQLSLVSYFIAMAAGQMLYGPLSDRIGRRLPLLAGLILFIVASVGAAMVTTIDALIVMRFVQGLGACAGMVLPRAIVRDLRSGDEAAKMFASMILVLGVSPILAPLLGSTLLAWFPWQALFWFQAGLGVLCLAMSLRFLKETHAPDKRSTERLGILLGIYSRLVIERPFILPVMIGGFSQSVLFAYLGASPFIYITLYHVDPSSYSVLFAMNAIGLIGLAQVNVVLIRRFGAAKLLRFATLVQLSAATVLLGSVLMRADSLILTGVCLFFCVGVQGLIGPTTSMLSMEPYPEKAGAASALSGMMQFACGAIASSLVSALFNGTPLPFAAVITGYALTGVVLSRVLSTGTVGVPVDSVA